LQFPEPVEAAQLLFFQFLWGPTFRATTTTGTRIQRLGVVRDVSLRDAVTLRRFGDFGIEKRKIFRVCARVGIRTISLLNAKTLFVFIVF
jgi:hypothetical protein